MLFIRRRGVKQPVCRMLYPPDVRPRRRVGLTAFHANMAVVYLVIIWAYETGRQWLGFSVWVTAFSACAVLGVACGVVMLRAWRPKGGKS
jgi:hypothetical protein